MQRIILAGCGHAHLAVVARAGSFRDRGIELVLIDPGKFWYSGRGSAVLGGRFDEARSTIDPRRLAESCGAVFLEDRVAGLDRGARAVLLKAGAPLGYDLVSFNIGSTVEMPVMFLGGDGRISAAKPIAALRGIGAEIAAISGQQRIVVVGGGATGCEIAGNLLHLADRRGLRMAVTLVAASAELLPQAPRNLRLKAMRSLTSRGVVVWTGDGVAVVEPGRLHLVSGKAVGYDRVILATGLEAHPLMGSLDLPLCGGGLLVAPTLQSIGDPLVFAAGDCAGISGHVLPKLGVYGVRAGAVLAGNLLAAAQGRGLADYRPQSRALSIVDLADGRALAMRGGRGFEGRSMLVLKNWLDQRFLDRYRRLYLPT